MLNRTYGEPCSVIEKEMAGYMIEVMGYILSIQRDSVVFNISNIYHSGFLRQNYVPYSAHCYEQFDLNGSTLRF